jgi:uncharacterized membrane protein
MPTLAQIHPQVVHFAIALLFVGVFFRLVSLTGRFKFTDHAAAGLLVVGAIAALVSVRSGDAAHGPAERIPGARGIVIEHEESAEKTQDIFLVVGLLELAALGLVFVPRGTRFVKVAHIASAAVGIFGATTLYKTAELGGEVVYKYAAGPGLRSGDDADVARLLLAGLHNQAQADRRAKKPEDAARLVEEMHRRFPADTTVQFLYAESLLRDKSDVTGAMTVLAGIAPAPTDARLMPRKVLLLAEAWVAAQQPDSAKAVLDAGIAAFPQNTRLKARRDSLP